MLSSATTFLFIVVSGPILLIREHLGKNQTIVLQYYKQKNYIIVVPCDASTIKRQCVLDWFSPSTAHPPYLPPPIPRFSTPTNRSHVLARSCDPQHASLERTYHQKPYNPGSRLNCIEPTSRSASNIRPSTAIEQQQQSPNNSQDRMLVPYAPQTSRTSAQLPTHLPILSPQQNPLLVPVSQADEQAAATRLAFEDSLSSPSEYFEEENEMVDTGMRKIDDFMDNPNKKKVSARSNKLSTSKLKLTLLFPPLLSHRCPPHYQQLTSYPVKAIL